VHFSEVIYVFNNLRMKDYPWTDLDRKVADTLATYWTNFAKTGSPNATDLPKWPAYRAEDGYQVMRLAADSSAAPDTHRARYEFFESQILGK
jgi:para-nitrobenzyl esterase